LQIWRWWIQQHQRNERGRSSRVACGGHVCSIRGSCHLVGGAGWGERFRSAPIRHGGNEQQLRSGQHDTGSVQHDALDSRGHVHVRRRYGSVVGGSCRVWSTGQLDGWRFWFYGRCFFGSVHNKGKHNYDVVRAMWPRALVAETTPSRHYRLPLKRFWLADRRNSSVVNIKYWWYFGNELLEIQK